MINLVDNKVREEILHKIKSKYYLPVQRDCSGKWESKLKMTFIVCITKLSGEENKEVEINEYFNVSALVIKKYTFLFKWRTEKTAGILKPWIKRLWRTTLWKCH